MKTLHAVALASFALAMVFYLTPWPQGAMGLVVVGVVLESIAWIAIFKSRHSGDTGLAAPAPTMQLTDEPTTRESPP